MTLGSHLVKNSIITQRQLEYAEQLSWQQGSPLEEVILSQNYTNPKNLYSTIASYSGLEFADLLQTPCNSNLINSGHRPFYKSLKAIPWKQEGERVIIAATRITDELKQWAAITFEQYAFAITSPFDINHSINREFAELNSSDAIDILYQKQPQYSAKDLFRDIQSRVFLLFAAFMCLSFVFFTSEAMQVSFVIISFFYGTTLAVKTLLFLIGHLRSSQASQNHLQVPDKDLPVYTILVPLYKETRVLKKLTDAIRNLDYPKSKLDVKLIVEADDYLTINAIKELKCERMFEIIEVPYSLPRTKPKACNYALSFARGEYVTIYDAEDIPEPLQLKKVLYAFANSPEDVKCIQCKLNFFNHSENLLSKLFAIEYSTLFDFLLFGLEALQIPMPLGGTSNHFRKETLDELHGWDPYNVTEDADLGIRIAQKGWKCKIINSTTLEECPITISAWVRQRSRWIKGHMQTYFVHMRQPLELYKKTGAVGFFGIQFFLGAPAFIFLISPIMWTAWACFMLGILQTPQGMPQWFFTMIDFSLWMLVFGAIIQITHAIAAVHKNKWKGMTTAILSFPLYWFLHSIASFKALWQLITKPYYWEKTTHGVTALES